MNPRRLQRKRTKGFKLPAGAVCCTRPGKLGNPFTANGCRDAGFSGSDRDVALRCVSAFSVWLGPLWRNNWDGVQSENARNTVLETIPKLRGKDLACYCALCPDHADGKPLGITCEACAPCHVDVILEIANKESS